MGTERGIRSIFLQGRIISYAHVGRTDSFLGAVVEEMADRLAECVCTVLRCSSAIVIVLASVRAQYKLSGQEEEVEKEVNIGVLIHA